MYKQHELQLKQPQLIENDRKDFILVTNAVVKSRTRYIQHGDLIQFTTILQANEKFKCEI